MERELEKTPVILTKNYPVKIIIIMKKPVAGEKRGREEKRGN